MIQVLSTSVPITIENDAQVFAEVKAQVKFSRNLASKVATSESVTNCSPLRKIP